MFKRGKKEKPIVYGSFGSTPAKLSIRQMADDFVDKDHGKSIPYGVYDIGASYAPAPCLVAYRFPEAGSLRRRPCQYGLGQCRDIREALLAVIDVVLSPGEFRNVLQ